MLVCIAEKFILRRANIDRYYLYVRLNVAVSHLRGVSIAEHMCAEAQGVDLTCIKMPQVFFRTNALGRKALKSDKR